MEEIIQKIKNAFTNLLKQEPVDFSSSYIWNVDNQENQIFCSISINFNYDENNFSVSVYSPNGIFELHKATNFKVLPMNEISIWAENENHSLCSIMSISDNLKITMLTNVDKNLLKKSIDELNESELFISAQLSMIYDGE